MIPYQMWFVEKISYCNFFSLKNQQMPKNSKKNNFKKSKQKYKDKVSETFKIVPKSIAEDVVIVYFNA